MASMSQDFVGRVERLPLPPSETNSLMPLYEAVSNALHAVEDRHGDDAPQKGDVHIGVIREDVEDASSRVVGFQVTDNGIGLNDDNFKAFSRPDTRHKKKRGGKGVGRLGWLKVFEEIRVDSAYADGKVIAQRAFNFILREENQLDERPPSLDAPQNPGTVISLRTFTSSFAGRCPVRPETLRQRLIAHFLPAIVAEKTIPIRLTDGQEVVTLHDWFKAEVRSTAEKEVMVELEGEEHAFKVRHIRVSKAMRPEKGSNRLFLCADGRTVEQHGIDLSLGLGALTDGDTYVGCVSGDLLDRHVNAERTGFTLEQDVLRELRQRLVVAVSEFLEKEVGEMRAAKRARARQLLRTYPQFLFLNEDMDGFVSRLKASARSEEEIYVAMAQERYRRTKTVASLEKQISRKGEENVKELSDRYSKMVTLDQKGVLAEYVVRRKAVLDLLDKLQEYADDEEKRHQREDALHRLVCPMQTDSSKTPYENHNLWLLDDRLAFFAYFNSDSKLKSYTDLPSEDRPDLAFFYDTVSAWVDKRTSPNTVVLVEFKRPMRNDYTGTDNPVRQLQRYVEQLRTSKSLLDHTGKQKPTELGSAAYHCYVVADITESLEREVALGSVSPTPDGKGLFGYVGNRGKEFYLEIIPYAKLLTDAQQRNAVFFEKLGITDLDPSKVPDSAVTGVLGEPEEGEGDEDPVEQLVDT